MCVKNKLPSEERKHELVKEFSRKNRVGETCRIGRIYRRVKHDS
jgi:hypothetical protein